MSNYQTSFFISGFQGLREYDNDYSRNTDPRYAVDGQNFECKDGVLMSGTDITVRRSMSDIRPLGDPSGTAVDAKRIKSSVVFYRLNRSESAVLEGHLLLAFGDGRIYVKKESETGFSSNNRWYYLDAGPFQSDYWSFVSYEANTGTTENPALTDILLICNKKDGLYKIDGNTLAVTHIETPKNFSHIASFNERLWGLSGDTITYSVPYDPTNWTINDDIPEDGAGDISIPSWDGESFTGLVSFGSQLLIFKRSHIWSLTGTDPASYNIQERYGGGTIFPRTVTVQSDRVFMLTGDGVCMYDGNTVHPFQQEALRRTWQGASALQQIERTQEEDAELDLSIDKPVGILWKGIYYVSIPVFRFEKTNMETVSYNTKNNTWARNTAWHVGAYAITQDGLAIFNRGADPYVPPGSGTQPEVAPCQQAIIYEDRGNKALTLLWESTEIDFGIPNVVKSRFEVRFHLKASGPDGEEDILKVKLKTERGDKTREISLNDSIDKDIRLRFNLSGRAVSMEIYVAYGRGYRVRIEGGLHIYADTTPD